MTAVSTTRCRKVAFARLRIAALVPLALLAVGCGAAAGSQGRKAGPAGKLATDLPAVQVNSSAFAPVAAAFTTPLRGWVLGRAGCRACLGLLRTRDGGAHWLTLPDPPARLSGYGAGRVAVSDMAFADASNGFLFDPGLLATHNGGRSWKRVHLPPVVALKLAGGYGYALTQQAAGEPYALWRTAIGSSRWSRLPMPPGAASAPAYSHGTTIAASGRTVVLIQSGSGSVAITRALIGRLWVSQDAGRTWRRRAVPCAVRDGGLAVLAIVPSQPDHWLADCFDNNQSSQEQDTTHYLFGTRDGGRTWSLLGVPTRHNAPWLLAANGTGRAFLATEGDFDTLYGTLNGHTWRALLRSGGSFSGWADLTFLGSRAGYVVAPTSFAVGVSHLYRTTDGGRTWTVVSFGS